MRSNSGFNLLRLALMASTLLISVVIIRTGFALANTPEIPIKNAIADDNRITYVPPAEAAEYRRQGDRLYLEGKLQEAIENYNRAIEIAPNFGEAYYRRGMVRYKQKDYQAALDDFNQAMEKLDLNDPASAMMYYNRGLAYYNLGEKQKARSDWQIAADMFKSNGNNSGYRQAINALENYR